MLMLLGGSGCAALIYEIVWFQFLQLVIGSSAISLGLLLAVYMGGLCLGSLALPRLMPLKQHPVRFYAFLETGIAALGIVVLFTVPFLSRAYAGSATPGVLGIVLRATICTLCLLPSTILMGATLPVISRCLNSTRPGWRASAFCTARTSLEP